MIKIGKTWNPLWLLLESTVLGDEQFFWISSNVVVLKSDVVWPMAQTKGQPWRPPPICQTTLCYSFSVILFAFSSDHASTFGFWGTKNRIARDIHLLMCASRPTESIRQTIVIKIGKTWNPSWLLLESTVLGHEQFFWISSNVVVLKSDGRRMEWPKLKGSLEDLREFVKQHFVAPSRSYSLHPPATMQVLLG